VRHAETIAVNTLEYTELAAAEERLILVERQHMTAALAETAAAEAAEYAQMRHTLVMGQASTGYKAMSLASNAAAGAASILGGVITFLGGPIGALVTILGAAAVAWSVYSSKQKQAADEARAAGKELQAQADAIKEKERLEKIGDKRLAYSDKNQEFFRKVEDAQALRSAGYTPAKIPGFDSLADAEDEMARRKANQAIIGEAANREAQKNREAELAAAAERERELREKLAGEYRKLDETRMKNRLELIKSSNAEELNELKDWAGQGLLTTSEYYDRQRELLKSTNAAELAELNNHRTMIMEQMGSATDPEKRIKMQIDLEVNSGQINKLKQEQQGRLDQLAREEQKALREQQNTFDGYAADRLEMEGKFVEAAQKRYDIEWRSERLQRILQQAEAGDVASIQAKNNILLKQSSELFDKKTKEIEAARAVADAENQSYQDELQRLHVSDSIVQQVGKEYSAKVAVDTATRALKKAESLGNQALIAEETSKLKLAQDRLAAERQTTAEKTAQLAFDTGQAALNAEAQLAELKGNKTLADALRNAIAINAQREQSDKNVAELEKQIKGSVELINDAYNKGLTDQEERYKQIKSNQETRLETEQQILGILKSQTQEMQDQLNKARSGLPTSTTSTATGTSTSSIYVLGGATSDVTAPFMGGSDIPSYAIGTNYVPADGYAYIHEGEAVVPKKYNPAAGSTASAQTQPAGDTYHFHGNMILPNVTNQSTARELFAEFQKLARRQAAK